MGCARCFGFVGNYHIHVNDQSRQIYDDLQQMHSDTYITLTALPASAAILATASSSGSGTFSLAAALTSWLCALDPCIRDTRHLNNLAGFRPNWEPVGVSLQPRDLSIDLSFWVRRFVRGYQVHCIQQFSED
jgi:hypothetical protein